MNYRYYSVIEIIDISGKLIHSSVSLGKKENCGFMYKPHTLGEQNVVCVKKLPVLMSECDAWEYINKQDTEIYKMVKKIQ